MKLMTPKVGTFYILADTSKLQGGLLCLEPTKVGNIHRVVLVSSSTRIEKRSAAIDQSGGVPSWDSAAWVALTHTDMGTHRPCSVPGKALRHMVSVGGGVTGPQQQ